MRGVQGEKEVMENPLPPKVVATLAMYQQDIETIGNQRAAYFRGVIEALGVDLEGRTAKLSEDGASYTVVPKEG